MESLALVLGTATLRTLVAEPRPLWLEDRGRDDGARGDGDDGRGRHDLGVRYWDNMDVTRGRWGVAREYLRAARSFVSRTRPDDLRWR